MVTIGVDLHKRTHTLVVVDPAGLKLGTRTVEATTAGHLGGLSWVAQRWPQRRWALEDCRNLSRRFEADLLRAGETVVRVPPKLTAGARQTAREPGKSDPIDALAVARAALREPDLPTAQLEGEVREIRLLLDHREDLVAERTRIQNRLRWHLHELDPGNEPAPRSLDRAKVLRAVEQRLTGIPGVVARLARELVDRCRQLTLEIDQLRSELEGMVARLAPSLLTLQGCGALTAAKLVGEVVDIGRFRSRAAFAKYNGTAPIPAGSGNSHHHRLNRGGNRQVNLALHRMAITQLRCPGRGQDYFQYRLTERATKREAIRSLKRRISDEVYRRLWADLPHLQAVSADRSEAA
jgi:transposase